MKKLIIVLTLMFVTTLALASCGEGNSSTRATREDLVGVWVVDSGSGRGTTLSLNDDGTGRRGGFPGETFDWSMSGTTLRINRRNAPAREESNERWRFTIEGDVLRLESRQQTGLTRTHFRDGALGEPDPAIIGIWAWNTNAYWEYQFDADGSGRRGEHGSFTAFTWGVTDETLRIRLNSTPNVAGVLRNESWRFTIGSGDNGETLRLESMNN
ncbi:MAG: hypothetical protein FWC89_10075, partial [Defluviitaleaceae bacterium]|nr:hypothetical protein [Defluviitaleaceae bacterium]